MKNERKKEERNEMQEKKLNVKEKASKNQLFESFCSFCVTFSIFICTFIPIG